MKQVHIECNPDGLLVSKLGFKERYITHNSGKSRVYTKLSRTSSSLAMVDEDPGGPKHPYENRLIFNEEKEGIKLYSDSNKNKVLMLNVKLENWILSVCRSEKIDPEKFGLSSSPKQLHDNINNQLDKFSNLIDELISRKNSAIIQLKSWLR